MTSVISKNTRNNATLFNHNKKNIRNINTLISLIITLKDLLSQRKSKPKQKNIFKVAITKILKI